MQSTTEHTSTDERKAEQLRNLLRDSTDESISGLLEELREQGDFYAVEPLVELLFSTRSEPLKRRVVGLLADLSDQRAADVIARCIKRHRNAPELAALVSVCWQSRLDFSHHTSLFVDLLRNAPMTIGIEAYSVLDSMLPMLPTEQRALCLATLRKGITSDEAMDNAGLIAALLTSTE